MEIDCPYTTLWITAQDNNWDHFYVHAATEHPKDGAEWVGFFRDSHGMEGFLRGMQTANDKMLAELSYTKAENAAELGKALDVCIAERDQAYRDLDAQTLKANSFRRELHRYMQHAIELKDMLDASVAERDSAFAELDKHRRELTALRDERPRLLAANVRLFHDNNKLRRMSSLWKRTAKHYKRLRINDDRFRLLAESTFAKENEQLRAELDAMRQAHSVIVGRMEAISKNCCTGWGTCQCS